MISSAFLGILYVFLGGVAAALISAAVLLYISRIQRQTATQQIDVSVQGQALSGLASLADARGDELDRATKRIDLLQKDSDLKDEKIHNLEKHNVNLQSELYTLRVENDAIRRENIEIRKENAAITLRCSELEAQLKQALADNATLRGQLADVVVRVAALEASPAKPTRRRKPSAVVVPATAQEGDHA
jgi:chromosome segregation ATPase